MTISEIGPLQSPLAAVQRLLERFDNRGVIIRGVAASVLGTPRLTADVDVVILLSVNRLPRLDVDRSRIERWVRDFASALDMPELWDDIVPLLH